MWSWHNDQNWEINTNTIQLTKQQTSSGFHQMWICPQMSFSLFQDIIQILFCVYLSCLFPWSLSFLTLGSWRLLVSYFVKCPSVWVCHDFSWLDWGYAVWKEYHRSDTVYFLMPHIWRYMIHLSYYCCSSLS